MSRVNYNESTPTSPVSALSPETALSPVPDHLVQEDIEMEDNFREEVHQLSNIDLDPPSEPSMVNASSSGPSEPISVASQAIPSDGNNTESVITPAVNSPDQKDQGQHKNLNMSRKDNHTDKFYRILLDPVTSLKTTQELIAMYEIKIMRLRLEHMEKKNKKEATEVKEMIDEFTVADNTKKFPVPVFQLSDDHASSKTENKASYENAATFVTAFENVLDANEVNIETDWKNYLFNSFIFSKNKKYVSFYNNRLNVLKDKKWAVIKHRIIDRFGTSNDIVNNIDTYISCFTKKKRRRSEITWIVILIRQIHTIITTRYQVGSQQTLLKRNKPQDKTSYLPDSLTTLFTTIEENIGEIQEALYMAVSKPSNNGSHYNNNNKRDRNQSSSAPVTEEQNKKVKTNPENGSSKSSRICNYCNKAPFSYDHMNNECIPYLKSNKYKEFIRNGGQGKKKHSEENK
ncbi:unnamed protein product [Mucor hiemalis]